MNDPLKLVGQVLGGKYLIQAFVSAGGFATVYRAQHAIWKKPVAIKLFSGLSSAPEELRASLYQAFIQEGAFLSELCTETASIVQPRDVGAFTAEDGQWLPYMVLEWLEGQNLDQLLMQERSLHARPWLLQEVIVLLSQVAMALDIAHEKAIAHRDVKPSNLFLVSARARAEIGTIKVLDFGVAKLMSDIGFTASLSHTGAHVSSFTPQYAAPEQFNRELGATGPWTDVYSLALVAVELLAGRSPTQGDDLEALASAATNATRRPTPLSLGVPVSPEVEAVFARALAVTPRQRYHRAGQFWLELEAASGLPMTFATRERAARVGFAPTPIAARPIAPGSTPPYALSSAPSHATRGPDGRIYPWGDEPPSAQHLNACGSECSAWGKQQHTELTALYPEDDGYVATAPVGSFAKGRSRFGPYDVVGNVWEWTSTWYGPYSLEKSRNPQGPERGERRVIRGGAFNGGYESWLHPSFRYGQVPVAQSHGIGFRCAATIATAKH